MKFKGWLILLCPARCGHMPTPRTWAPFERPHPKNSMKYLPRKTASFFNIAVLVFASSLVFSQKLHAQFFDFVRAIPQNDSTGAPIAGANTTFADGSAFVPDTDVARSSKWSWRTSLGIGGVLNSLGPTSSTPPSNTKELVTTISGLKPNTSYDVKVLYWESSNWGIRAGLTYAYGTRTNTWFDTNSTAAVTADLLPWRTLPPIWSESGRTLNAGSLGTATANANGQVKVFIHDLPSADSNTRTWYQGVAIAEVIAAAPHVVDTASAGTYFNRGVHAQALTDVTIDRGEYWVGIPKALEVTRGSAIRGVATGIAAELYDWRTRNGQARPPTLQFLRYSRDFDAQLFLEVNMRGFVQPNPAGGFLYYDTNITSLATAAADWVRYVNHIVPTYRQGDSITNSRDAAILSSLTWSSSVPGDSFDTLLNSTESAVPQVKYWEIGNEPTVGTTAYNVSNSFTLTATNYYPRYKAITQAMKAENPNVKVGPTIIDGSREESQLTSIASDLSCPIDFVAYHPYERMGQLTDPAQITRHLGSVWSRQSQFLNGIKQVLSDNGRDPSATEYAATEVNVSYWDTNDSDKEARMAHALGTVETVFTHARLGLIASLYWVWPAHRYDGTEYPSFRAYQNLRDHMGDTLLSTYAFQDIRLYTTRDSRTGELAVWVLNFSNDQDSTVQLKLQNLPTVQRATLLRLQDVTAKTTLFSSNLASDMLGGPSAHVDWTSTNMTGQNLRDMSLNLPAATISLLVIQPGVGSLKPTFVDQAGVKHFAVTFAGLPHASDVRYNLWSSDDLVTWEVVGQAEPGAVSITDNRPANASTHRFYRVEAVNQ
jgi:hypothetical protein